MTPLQRVTKALEGKMADRVPCIPLVCGASRRVYGCNYAEWSQDGEIAAKSLLQAQDLLGYDAIMTEIDLNVEAGDMGQELEYSVDDQSFAPNDRLLIRAPEDYLTRIQPVDPTRSPRMSDHIRTCDMIANERGDTVPVFGFVYSPLGVLSVMRGPELLFADCVQHPEKVRTALETITAVLEDYIKALSQTGIHALWIETLFGNNKHMSKKLWLQTEGPFLARLSRAARGCGLKIIAHSSGVDFYMDAHLETLEPVAMSCAWVPHGCTAWAETKAKWGRETCLIGHVFPIPYLYLGQPDDVMEECRKEIEELGPEGGYILAPGWEFPYDATLVNARAMVRAAKRYGRYDGAGSPGGLK